MGMKFEGMNMKSLLKSLHTVFIAVADILLTLPNKVSVHVIQLRWPEPIYMQHSYVF